MPDEKIQKTAFLPIKKHYGFDQVVTKGEIKDSIILKDSLFEFKSVCKIPVVNA